MLGIAPAVAALLVAGQFDPGAGALLEARGGEAPLIAGASPVATVGAILTPSVDVRYLSHDLVLTLAFNERIYARVTSANGAESPLRLHTGLFSADGRPTARSHVTSTATVVEGQADYSYLTTILGPGQQNLTYVPKVFSASGEVKIDERATERVDLSLLLDAIHHRPVGPSVVDVPVGTTDMMPGAMPMTVPLRVPIYTSVAATPSLAFRITRTDMLKVSCELETQHVTGLSSTDLTDTNAHTLDSYTAIPTIGVVSFFARRNSLDLHVGLGINHLVSTIPVEAYSIAPLGGAIYEQRLLGWRESILTLVAGEVVDFYVDPVLAIASPRSLTSASLVLVLPQFWSVGLEGTYSSSFSAHPLGSYYPDEVAYSLAVPVRHRVSEYLSMEFGARWSDRSPFYTVPAPFDVGFHQRQVWLYVTLAATTRPTKRPTNQ